jgi:two-component system cell cycle sensor histidine kinase/response regulator CckA
MATRFSAAPLAGVPPRPILNAALIAFGLLSAAGTAVLIVIATHMPLLAFIFLAGFASILGLMALLGLFRSRVDSLPERQIDWNLVLGAVEDATALVAITDAHGELVCANRQFERWFGGLPTPPTLPLPPETVQRIAEAGRAARRDGGAAVDGLRTERGKIDVIVRRAGENQGHLIWRFRESAQGDGLSDALRLISGESGQRFGSAGVMVALVDVTGRGLCANSVFLQRALGSADATAEGWSFAQLLSAQDEIIRFIREGEQGNPLRVIQIALGDRDEGAGAMLFLIVDEDRDIGLRSERQTLATIHLHGLLGMLPLGLALAERDGRVLFMNDPFIRAAGLAPDATIVYPSDLVVEDEKGMVSDAVRRLTSGRGKASDLAVRLKERPDESVTLTLAAAKGLGEAAVLLSLKDNSEETRLRRQVAQAMKMQAVGQLAGGVAHDFNNILTAIIGHCDLMAMRHMPGDSDYDDIQQIKHNSNRAAALTRQLLAFSRQQTLRPQILQLPDVISEISSLLKRLLGETVTLNVSHGRNLGTVRADPGQLEQVIVNLAVNARDAMADGGTLTIQTYAMSIVDVRRLNIEIMPMIEYTALKISDTGCGIPPEVITKIFEPFFTTKEVGKGTGLGLSTVYGIVKQTEGFIFAESEIGKGTSFVIYLPVHEATDHAPVAVRIAKEVSTELWGTGTILLVEDEAMVRAVAERALTRQGYTVLTATNGDEGLEILEGDTQVDLVISDVVMPAMDGPTMARLARKVRPDLPIIFMSGYAEEQLRRSIDIDRIGFLPKPFSVQQICSAAKDVLAETTKH